MGSTKSVYFLINFNEYFTQIDEEQMLLAELKKIEARKRERERKTQDLQKLISRADSGNGVSNSQQNVVNEIVSTPSAASNIARRHDRKLHKKKIATQQRPIRTVETVVSVIVYFYY